MDIDEARKKIDGWFPNLAAKGYDPKSEEDGNYNCIAWAAGETHRRWDPAPGYHWPEGIARDDKIETLILVFESLSYHLCEQLDASSIMLEAGIGKVVLYADEGEWTHVARQLPSGRWTSKLGDHWDIEHDAIDAFGEFYADPVHVMRSQPEV